MKRTSLVLVLAAALACTAPAWAQHGGGRPAGKGPGSTPGASSSSPGPSHGTSATANSSPSDVLSHNTAIAGKIKTLTGQDAQTACNGFKNLGQCVAAAHVAKNLDIPGGFDALRAKLTGPNGESLGKAIHDLKPDADAKAEVKKAQREANKDIKDSSS